MNPRPPEPYNPVTKQPRRIPWTRWLLIAGGMVLVLVAAGWAWVRSYKRITVAKDTTYLAAPLAADGYPDYVAALHQQGMQGITPENNAFVPLLRGLDSNELDDAERAKLSKALGLTTQILQPNAYVSIYTPQFEKSLTEELYIASSAAGQYQWHVKFARLAALNVNKFAEHAWIGSAPGQVHTPDEYAEDEEAIPDLRPAALALRQPPELTDAEEIAAWRKEQLDNARDKIFEREDLIIYSRPWSRAECPIAAYWLDTQSANLDRLVSEILARPRFYAPYKTSDEVELAFSILLPGPQMLRGLSRDLQIRAREALQRGDLDAAIRDFESQLRLATYVPDTPLLVEALVGIAMHGMAMETLQAIVFHPAATDAQLAALAPRLEQPFPFPDFGKSYELERFAVLDYFVATVARGVEGREFGNVDFWQGSIVCWNDVLRRINELFDAGIAAAKKRDWPALQQLVQQIDTQPAHYLELRAAYSERSFWLLPSQRTEVIKYAAPRETLGAVFNAYSTALRGEVRHDAARVLLALERYRRANQSYPAALAELVPTYLPAVPMDPFDGKPLKYLRSPAGGYRAYSVWTNGIDDGGIPHLRADGSQEMRGNDLVIGSPDEVPPKLNLAW